jgi:hypothetical protein
MSPNVEIAQTIYPEPTTTKGSTIVSPAKITCRLPKYEYIKNGNGQKKEKNIDQDDKSPVLNIS